MKTLRVVIEFEVSDECPDQPEMELTDSDVLDGFDLFIRQDHTYDEFYVVPNRGRITEVKEINPI